MIRPVPVSREILLFYLPVCLSTMVVVALVMFTRRVSRLAGALLVALYAGFVAGAFVWGWCGTESVEVRDSPPTQQVQRAVDHAEASARAVKTVRSGSPPPRTFLPSSTSTSR